jgi:hypothetical protein
MVGRRWKEGLDVICDKPMTNTVCSEAEELVRLVEECGLVFCLTHNYTGYPMVRQARAMVEDDATGPSLGLVQVEYVQGRQGQGRGPRPGRRDPSTLAIRPGQERAVPGAWRYRQPCPQPGAFHHRARGERGGGRGRCRGAQPCRRRFRRRSAADGARSVRGSFWVTQAAAGVENCLRVSGSAARSGRWSGCRSNPRYLYFRPLGCSPAEVQHPATVPGTLPLAVPLEPDRGRAPGRLCRRLRQSLQRCRRGQSPPAARVSSADPLAQHFPHGVWTAWSGVRFIDRCSGLQQSGRPLLTCPVNSGAARTIS